MEHNHTILKEKLIPKSHSNPQVNMDSSESDVKEAAAMEMTQSDDKGQNNYSQDVSTFPADNYQQERSSFVTNKAEI